MKKLLTGFIFLLPCVQLFAQPQAVAIRCVSVNEDLSVIITWEQSTDSDFQAYELYYRAYDMSDFSLLVTLPNINTVQYIHPDTIANTAGISYFLRVQGSGVNNRSESSDTLTTLFLNVGNPEDQGRAELNWVNHQNDVATTIEKQFPDQAWAFLEDSPAGEDDFSDTIKFICDDTIGYRVYQDYPGCRSYANPVFDRFKDRTRPQSPFMERVSVLEQGQGAQIFWSKPPDIDLAGYLLYRVPEDDPNGAFILIDSIRNPNTLDYIHDSLLVEQQSVVYQIEAYDDCFYLDDDGKRVSNLSSPNGSNHQTIYLEATTFNCSETVLFQWNEYILWSPSVSMYTLYYQNLSTSVIQEITFPGGQESYEYLLEDLTIGAQYKFWVEATNGTYQSASNKLFIDIDNIQLADQPYITHLDTRYASYSIQTITTNLNGASSYIVQRQVDGNWQTLKSVMASSELMEISFEVTNGDSITVFRTGLINACLTDTVFSEPVESIFLEGQINELNISNELTWNLIDPWENVVQDYQVYLVPPDGSSDLFIESLLNSVSEFEHENNIANQTSGRFCYYIVAQEGNNQFGYTGSFYSNVTCLNQPHRIYVPNAFTPGGNNPIFKAYGVFVETEQYKLTVYDQWQRTVFISENAEQGWDGSYRGADAPQGTYVYSLTYEDAEGRNYFKTGTVTLLR